MFDTGTYEYDGALNITAIRNQSGDPNDDDIYLYDLAGRLRRARMSSEDFPSGLYLDYRYDIFGNMEERQTGITETSVNQAGPIGLHFSGRTSSAATNRIDGFGYDANGNLTDEPPHEGVGASATCSRRRTSCCGCTSPAPWGRRRAGSIRSPATIPEATADRG